MNSIIDENLYNENFVGNMELICNFCEAKHFPFELKNRKNFNICCHKGKVKLPDDPSYPEEIKSLIIGNSQLSRHFKHSIRNYNNAMAFASFGATYDKLYNKGPPIVRICGQVYHNTYSLHPTDNDSRKYGQLYIIDNEMATKNRKNNNSDCRNEILLQLDNIIRNNNPYANAYKMMHEVEKEIYKNSSELENEGYEIKMIMKRDIKNKRYDCCTSNEVAIVFVDNDGKVPKERDFCIYSKKKRTYLHSIY